jgi:hypothetical protein
MQIILDLDDSEIDLLTLSLGVTIGALKPDGGNLDPDLVKLLLGLQRKVGNAATLARVCAGAGVPR